MEGVLVTINSLAGAAGIGMVGSFFKGAAYMTRIHPKQSTNKVSATMFLHGAGNLLFSYSLYKYLSKVAPTEIKQFNNLYGTVSVMSGLGAVALNKRKTRGDLSFVPYYVLGEIITFVAIAAIMHTPFLETDVAKKLQCRFFSIMQLPYLGVVGYATYAGPGKSNTPDMDPSLPSFMRDLTEEAQDKVYSEPEGLFLNLRTILLAEDGTANNLMLVGDSGSGKTATIERLAFLIKQNDIPGFENCRVYSLTANDLEASDGVGHFARNIQNVKTFVEGKTAAGGKVILFIDELHQLIGAGAHRDNANGADQHLLPLLTNPNLRVIGASTPSDLRHFQSNMALYNRFTRLDIKPLSSEQRHAIVLAILERYELPATLADKESLKNGVPRTLHRILALTKSRMNTTGASAEEAFDWANNIVNPPH